MDTGYPALINEELDKARLPIKKNIKDVNNNQQSDLEVEETNQVEFVDENV